MLAQTLKNSETKRVYLSKQELDGKYNELRASGEAFISSTSSLYVLSAKTKYIDRSYCVEWPDLLGEVLLLLPGEIARTELYREFGKPKIWVKKSDFNLLDISPPCFWDGEERKGELYYVDLNGAYHAIYRELTLDCVWPRGTGELYLGPVAQRLANNKLARNSLVGITRTSTISMVKDGVGWEQKFMNPFFNPAVWYHIQSFLHELANIAIGMGARYVATDGYIFDNGIGFNNFRQFLWSIGLAHKIDFGDGYINGWAAYKVNKKQTKVSRKGGGKIDTIWPEKDTINWWKRIRNLHLDP